MTNTDTITHFDGTRIAINAERILITEGDVSLDLWFEFMTDGIVADAVWRVRGMDCTQWVADRLVFCAELARRRVV